MKILPLFSGCCLFVSTVAGLAELPRYSVEKVSSFFPLLGPDQGVHGSGTNLNGVSAGGTHYMASFADYANPATPPGSQLSPRPKAITLWIPPPSRCVPQRLLPPAM